MNKEKIQGLKCFLTEIENLYVTNENDSVTIRQLALRRQKEAVECDKLSKSPVDSVVSTALVINWGEELARPRIKHFKKKQINSIEMLYETILNTEPKLFLKEYLDINSDKPTYNPKYKLLKTLCQAFLKYKTKHNFESEIEAMIHWADNLDIKDLDNDTVGKNYGVSYGVVQNIKLTLGYNVIKPDRHVLKILKERLNKTIKPQELSELAVDLEMSELYLDTLLFEYGKLISKN